MIFDVNSPESIAASWALCNSRALNKSGLYSVHGYCSGGKTLKIEVKKLEKYSPRAPKADKDESLHYAYLPHYHA